MPPRKKTKKKVAEKKISQKPGQSRFSRALEIIKKRESKQMELGEN